MVNREYGKWNGRMAGFILFPLWLHYFRKNRKGKRDDMPKRFVTIWFRHLKTDWLSHRQPDLLHTPFVLAFPDHGRMVVTAVNEAAKKQGIDAGTVVADARAIYPGLQVFDDRPELSIKL